MLSRPAPGRQEEVLPGAAASGRVRPSQPARRRTKRPATKVRGRLRGPIRTLTTLLVLSLLLFAGLGAAHLWGTPKAALSPQLGLDLAGGRQVVLAPLTDTGATINAEQLDQAIDIIRRRVDGTGTAEAEVSRLGSNVAVAIPGNPTPAQLEALSRSSQMVFRPVLAAMPVVSPGDAPLVPRELPLPSQQLQDEVDKLTAPLPTAPADDQAQQTDENRGGERPQMASSDAAGSTAPAGADDPSVTSDPEAPAIPVADPSDLAQITPELQQQFLEADCTPGSAGAVALADAGAKAQSAKPLIACSTDGDEKYILGPVELSGGSLTDATAGLQQLQQGVVTGAWEVVLTFDAEGGKKFSEVTSRLMGFPKGAPQNRFAMVLDGEVISAPTVNSPITNGVATISGNFDADSA
ncbi:MAG: hypothetical protein Q4P07_12700, partial [Ornithinimicrobium sp.]|uniref:preprotein translocase subunit SecD n=1 Tax=Ornithinimicrobium sp. TaxID=1977084 RepID=UPI0026F6F117|nr:hypothetical protein [Ornithinimicrobium sp.]